jgi:hypothetical protein
MAAHRYHKVGDIETDGEQLKHNTLDCGEQFDFVVRSISVLETFSHFISTSSSSTDFPIALSTESNPTPLSLGFRESHINLRIKYGCT